MLPNVDITTNVVASGGQGISSRRQDSERAVEAYRAAQETEKVAAKQQERSAESESIVAAREEKATERVEKKETTPQDQVEINLQLSREERDAFAAAFGSQKEKAEMTAEERETVKKASERITKYVDETIAKNRENREKVEKAVGEWYSRLSKGDPWGPTDLIQLFRQAANGELDEINTL